MDIEKRWNQDEVVRQVIARGDQQLAMSLLHEPFPNLGGQLRLAIVSIGDFRMTDGIEKKDGYDSPQKANQPDPEKMALATAEGILPGTLYYVRLCRLAYNPTWIDSNN